MTRFDFVKMSKNQPPNPKVFFWSSVANAFKPCCFDNYGKLLIPSKWHFLRFVFNLQPRTNNSFVSKLIYDGLEGSAAHNFVKIGKILNFSFFGNFQESQSRSSKMIGRNPLGYDIWLVLVYFFTKQLFWRFQEKFNNAFGKIVKI